MCHDCRQIGREEPRPVAEAESCAPSPFSGDEADQIGADLISGEWDLMCPRCGTILTLSSPIGGGRSIALAWELRCPACNRSTIAGRAVERLLDRPHQGRVSAADRASARSLPGECLEHEGPARICAMALVDRHWYGYPPAERRDLAQLLVLLIPDWRSPGSNAEELEAEAEHAVVEWLERRNRRVW